MSFPDPPQPVLELISAFRRSHVMFAAVELGLFEALAANPADATSLATTLKCDPHALADLLGACQMLGLIEVDANRLYRNSPDASEHLTQSGPNSLLGYIRYSDRVLTKLWRHQADAVREGTPRWQQVYGWEGPIFSHFFSTEESKREFLMGMHGFGCLSSPAVVAAVDLTPFRTLVDLGGATGHLAHAACKQYPRLKAIVFDLPDAVPLANEVTAKSGVADRVTVQAGDFFHDPLPPADLYSLGRIIHDWSEPKIHTLLARIAEALPSGGGLLIAEKVLADDRAGPDWAVLQSLSMRVCTEGRERTAAEYSALLTAHGFETPQVVLTDSPLDAILARKA